MNIVLGVKRIIFNHWAIHNFGKVLKPFGYGEIRRTFPKVKRNFYYVNPEFDTERCYSFYEAFKLAKEAGEINCYMTFEQYLGKLIFLKELNELERLETEKLKKFEPEILIDNT